MVDENVAYLSDYQEPEHILGSKDIDDQLVKLHERVRKAFEDQKERVDDIADYWDIYNCVLNEHQFYDGDSKVYTPLVNAAVQARKTRFVNQIFPQSKRHVEAITTDGTVPDSLLSLAEHYISSTRLRTEIMPALCVNGDVEGSYHLGLSWRTFKRTIKRRVRIPIDPSTGAAKSQGQDEAVLTEEVIDGRPEVEVLHDCDITVFPASADSIEDALERGGGVAIIRRYSKSEIERLKDEGVFDPDLAEDLLASLDDVKQKINSRNQKKKLVENVGQKLSDKSSMEVYEIWTKLKIKDKPKAPASKDAGKTSKATNKQRSSRKLCQSFIMADGAVLGCRESIYWNNKVPILSCPVVKTAGVFKGDSRVKFCADMQYKANDCINIAMDSAMYSLMPIVMTDPESNPRVASMVMSMAAIWECNPNTTSIIQFPDLWEKGFALAGQAREAILQILSVTPAAITQGAAKKKPTQADIANEQMVDILTTADAVTVLEEGILTPLLQWFIDFDYQFRDRELTVKKYGPLGVEAKMEEIEPLQMNERVEFRWLGVEAARNAQQVQQQIAAMNILRGIPEQFYMGYTLSLQPAIAQLIESTFGPRLSRQIFKPSQLMQSMPPEQENIMLMDGFAVHVSPLDNDQEHIQAHAGFMKTGGPLADAHQMLRAHIQEHMMGLQKKQMAAAPGGQPGTPGGQQGKQGGGMPGQPRPGAMPMRSPTGNQNPPGAMPADAMNPAGRAARMQRGNAA
jgi:hypothetical protein